MECVIVAKEESQNAQAEPIEPSDDEEVQADTMEEHVEIVIPDETSEAAIESTGEPAVAKKRETPLKKFTSAVVRSFFVKPKKPERPDVTPIEKIKLSITEEAYVPLEKAKSALNKVCLHPNLRFNH